nr:MAG TPA: hypothetical protein [Caudoviricetes sp.]DAZ59694.1 MAG TPA: hypothetical protein [Caudoviricetes sp.]
MFAVLLTFNIYFVYYNNAVKMYCILIGSN